MKLGHDPWPFLRALIIRHAGQNESSAHPAFLATPARRGVKQRQNKTAGQWAAAAEGAANREGPRNAAGAFFSRPQKLATTTSYYFFFFYLRWKNIIRPMYAEAREITVS